MKLYQINVVFIIAMSLFINGCESTSSGNGGRGSQPTANFSDSLKDIITRVKPFFGYSEYDPRVKQITADINNGLTDYKFSFFPQSASFKLYQTTKNPSDYVPFQITVNDLNLAQQYDWEKIQNHPTFQKLKYRHGNSAVGIDISLSVNNQNIPLRASVDTALYKSGSTSKLYIDSILFDMTDVARETKEDYSKVYLNSLSHTCTSADYGFSRDAYLACTKLLAQIPKDQPQKFFQTMQDIARADAEKTKLNLKEHWSEIATSLSDYGVNNEQDLETILQSYYLYRYTKSGEPLEIGTFLASAASLRRELKPFIIEKEASLAAQQALIPVIAHTKGACIQGDCQSGIGKIQLGSGTFDGTFVAGLAVTGTFTFSSGQQVTPELEYGKIVKWQDDFVTAEWKQGKQLWEINENRADFLSYGEISSFNYPNRQALTPLWKDMNDNIRQWDSHLYLAADGSIFYTVGKSNSVADINKVSIEHVGDKRLLRCIDNSPCILHSDKYYNLKNLDSLALEPTEDEQGKAQFDAVKQWMAQHQQPLSEDFLITLFALKQMTVIDKQIDQIVENAAFYSVNLYQQNAWWGVGADMKSVARQLTAIQELITPTITRTSEATILDYLYLQNQLIIDAFVAAEPQINKWNKERNYEQARAETVKAIQQLDQSRFNTFVDLVKQRTNEKLEQDARYAQNTKKYEVGSFGSALVQKTTGQRWIEHAYDRLTNSSEKVFSQEKIIDFMCKPNEGYVQCKVRVEKEDPRIKKLKLFD